MQLFNNKYELISAKAWNNILVEGVENDFNSEFDFIASNAIHTKSKVDMNLKYGINAKAFVISDFGYCVIN